MSGHANEEMLSRLVDGDLDTDSQNEVLLQVLEDAEGPDKLNELLRLRNLFADWRSQESAEMLATPPEAQAKSDKNPGAGRFIPLAAAAVIGAVLFGAGFMLSRQGMPELASTKDPAGSGVSQTPMRTSSKERLRIAQVYRLHESVAGPLQWYVDDNEKVTLASIHEARSAGQPVAMLLRLTPTSNGTYVSKTYVVVCRNDEPSTIRLPELQGGNTPIELYVLPTARKGGIEMRYAITGVGDKPGSLESSGLLGRRSIGLDETRLGQLALGGKMVNVDATAWVISEDKTP